MQCPSCGFENMPGSDGCARCGTSLKIATMTLDVRPPRAASASGVGRRIWAARFRIINISRALQEIQAAWVAEGERRFDDNNSAWPLLWRTIVPGWPQRYRGQWWQSHVLFWPFITCLFLGLIDWGTVRGSWIFGGAFLIQQLALMDIFREHMPGVDFNTRVGRTFLGMAAIALGVWVPVFFVLLHVADPYSFNVGRGPFSAGDIVLVNHWMPARPGQMVLADVPGFQVVHGALYEHGHRERVMFLGGGEQVDRVMGVAGDSVEWKNGTLWRNGVATPWQPVNPQAMPDYATVQIDAGNVAIFPTANLPPELLHSDMDLSDEAQVPTGNLIGVVWFRWRPLSRLGWIF
jgi:hypothetical protein